MIYEFYSAGALPGSRDLVLLGFAMLDAVLADFTVLDDLEIFTILHPYVRSRLAEAPYLPKIQVHWTREEGGWLEQFEDALGVCDAALVIAPETDGILTKLVAFIEGKGKKILGSTVQAVALTSHKGKVIQFLGSRGLPVPQTEIVVNPRQNGWPAGLKEELALPVVLKPVYGTGGENVWVHREWTSVERWLQRPDSLAEGALVVQEYIPGPTVSASCLAVKGKALPLCLNQQIIAENGKIDFQGISTPYRHGEADKALNIAQRACESIDGLRGFVGVDMVLGPKGPVIIEVNPRITVAYVTLRQATKRNLAEDIWSSFRDGCLPMPPQFSGTYTYKVN